MTVKRLLVFILLLCVALPLVAQEPISPDAPDGGMQWWGWALLLFGFTLVLGVLAVVGGVGGGVLFVPIVSAIFPFNLDFVRGAGLMVALCGALSAAPRLLKGGLASLRLALPLALMGSIGSILGAMVGLALPTQVIQLLLGIAILLIVILMLSSKRSAFPEVTAQDRIAVALGIRGTYYEASLKKDISWTVHRMPVALVVFVAIGFFAGMFGLGAGWANVPALNLLLSAPLKVSVATSGLILAVNDTAAAWVYLNGGAVLALITVPSVAGMMIGTRVGARVLPKIKPDAVRWIVIGVLLLAGLRSLLAGLGVL